MSEETVAERSEPSQELTKSRFILPHANKDAWLEARRGCIGSSDAPTILGCIPSKSPFTLWAQKCGLIPTEDETEKMRWGNLLEPVIADEYHLHTERQLVDYGRHTIWLHQKLSFVSATIDREIRISGHPPGILEIKTTGERFSSNWSVEPPLPYQVQLQHQLAVTGWSWGSLCVLIGGQQMKWQDLERNDEFIEVMLEREVQFWECVQRGDPPEIDGTDSTAATLSDLYKLDSGKTIALPGIALEWDEKLCEVKSEIKKLEAEEQFIENNIKGEMKDATFGCILESNVTYSYKTQERQAYTVPAKSFRVLRRHQKGSKA